jgi:hypothetical protein
MNERDMGRETVQMLVVADTWCDASTACDEVWRSIGERQGTIFVVSPALAGRLHSLVSDTDHELAAAEARLKSVLMQLREHGHVAGGTVGDEDPLVAIGDALRQFPAEEILVVTTTATDQNWRERGLFERATGLGLPVSCVLVANPTGE